MKPDISAQEYKELLSKNQMLEESIDNIRTNNDRVWKQLLKWRDVFIVADPVAALKMVEKRIRKEHE